MSVVEEIFGDLLTVETDLIAHQTNCLTLKARGLAAAIFAKWPESNCYAERVQERGRTWADERTRSQTGKIRIDGRVVHLFAQWAPGQVDQYAYPKHPLVKETAGVRAGWFVTCLCELETTIRNMARAKCRKISIAFPRFIGCDLAGGNWDDYRAYIIQFAERLKMHARVVIVQLPDTKTMIQAK
jgi:O-acetyl-ADP-ribose deacetylase (regulator of RNase III)